MSFTPTFSPAARTAIANAQREAAACGNSTVHSEHVMLAFAEMPGAVGSLVREHLDVDALRRWAAGRPGSPLADEATFGDDTRAVLAAACAFARSLKQAQVEDAHLALGLLAPSGTSIPPFVKDVIADRRAFALGLRTILGDSFLVPAPKGTWRYAVDGSEKIDGGSLPLLLAIDAAFQEANIDVTNLPANTTISLSIREPGNDDRTIDLSLD